VSKWLFIFNFQTENCLFFFGGGFLQSIEIFINLNLIFKNMKNQSKAEDITSKRQEVQRYHEEKVSIKRQVQPPPQKD